MGWLKWVLLLLIVATIVLIWYCRPTPPKATTRLELETNGGFAYIHAAGDSELNVAFLKDARSAELDPLTGAPVCDVKQLGVELIVISGTIVSVSGPGNPSIPAPANRTFDLKGS